jgi:hypothetical protein
MVSGFFTSPNDHDLTICGEASPAEIEENSSWLDLSKFNKSFKVFS